MSKLFIALAMSLGGSFVFAQEQAESWVLILTGNNDEQVVTISSVAGFSTKSACELAGQLWVEKNVPSAGVKPFPGLKLELEGNAICAKQ
jgi:hypothetical protein